jgi:hypothetical protein
MRKSRQICNGRCISGLWLISSLPANWLETVTMMMRDMSGPERADFHRHMTIAVLTHVLECIEVSSRPVDEAYDQWQGGLSEGAQRMLLHEDPLFTAVMLFCATTDHRRLMEIAASHAHRYEDVRAHAIVEWYRTRRDETVHAEPDLGTLPPAARRLQQAIQNASKLQGLWHLSLFKEMEKLVEEGCWSDAIRLLVEHGRFSEAWLAHGIGTSRSTVSRWMRGETSPPAGSVNLILKTIEDLLLPVPQASSAAQIGEPTPWQISEQAINAVLELERSRLGKQCETERIRLLGSSLQVLARPPWASASAIAYVATGWLEILMQFHEALVGQTASTVEEIQTVVDGFARSLLEYGGDSDVTGLVNGCLVLQRIVHSHAGEAERL